MYVSGLTRLTTRACCSLNIALSTTVFPMTPETCLGRLPIAVDMAIFIPVPETRYDDADLIVRLDLDKLNRLHVAHRWTVGRRSCYGQHCGLLRRRVHDEVMKFWL